MKTLVIILSIVLLPFTHIGQTTSDLLNPKYKDITWLGVDYSHVKLIGDFSQFADAGNKSSAEIKNNYFPGWNYLFVREPKKFDFASMLKKDYIKYDIKMISEINEKTDIKSITAKYPTVYTKGDIKKFVQTYPIEGKSGIGILMIAESLNKNLENASYHFVALNMATKEILIQERFETKPSGFGLKNYWAGSVYAVYKKIKSERYKDWRKQYK